MEQNRKILIEALNKIVKGKEVTALPARPRNLAVNALNSDEILHLAKHIIKITLWPNSNYCKGWFKEIKTSLDNLAFKLCRFCVRKNEERVIKELWFGPKEILEKLNERLDEAYWDVMDEMKPMIKDIKLDPFIEDEKNNFTEIGYSISEHQNEHGSIQFQLSLNGKLFVF